MFPCVNLDFSQTPLLLEVEQLYCVSLDITITFPCWPKERKGCLQGLADTKNPEQFPRKGESGFVAILEV